MNNNFKIWFIWGELWSTDSFPIEIFGVLICVKEWKKRPWRKTHGVRRRTNIKKSDLMHLWIQVQKFQWGHSIWRQVPSHCACILYPLYPLTTLCFYSWLGELSQNPGDKKSERDFALWKASKPGEPAWDSPWGKVTIANNEDFL